MKKLRDFHFTQKGYTQNKYIGRKALGVSKYSFYNLLKKIYIPGKELKDLDIDKNYSKKLFELFATSNSELSERHQLNLEEYGYYSK